VADENYDVEAKITVKGDQSKKSVGGLVREVLGVTKATQSATGGIYSLLRSTVGLAGAYFGVRALTSGFMGLAASSFAYASTLDKQRTGLSAILAATQPMFAGIADGQERMNAAGVLGGAVFRQLQDDALKSVATSQEMFSIYSAIAGPLAGAGAKLSEIRQITNDTVSAASVLGVDFGQASRDIMLMSTGAAGMDTMLFRMLKSTGQITESTQEWNQMLPEKRLARIKESLSGYRAAAGAFEKTLPGVTSSVLDFFQRFRAAFMAGPLEGLRKSLVRLVGIFQTHQAKILSFLTTAGEMFAKYLDPVFDGVGNAVEYFLSNWEAIALTMQTTWNQIKGWGSFMGEKAQKYTPSLKTAAIGYVGVKVASAAVGGSLSGAAWTAISTKIAALAPVVLEIVKDLFAVGLGFQLVILPIVALVGLVGAMVDVWGSLMLVVMPIGMFLQEIFTTLFTLLGALLSAIWPLAKIIGIVLLGALVAVGGLLLVFARLVFLLIKPIIDGWTLIFEYIGKGLDIVYGYFVKWFEGIAKFFGKVLDIGYGVNKGEVAGKDGSGWIDGFMDSFKANFEKFSSQKGEDESLIASAEAGNKGKAKATTVNDFRGSKIEVKQDFRQADPDRVWLQMVDGINEAATKRMASALTPDFTR
jgi:hypothetical protein